MRFEKNVAVITGGTRGLGKAIAGKLLDEGATVVCAARGEGEMADLRKSHGERAAYEYVDVTEYVSVEKMANRVVELYGVPSVVVSNAGISRDGKVLATAPDDWSDVIDINVNGVFHTTRVLGNLMAEAGGGRIVNLSSVMGTRPAAGAASYCTSKAAIEMFTRVSAMELGGKGVRVNALAPGFFTTGMGARLMESGAAWDAYRSKISVRRPGDPEELAAAAAFLASEESSYINGHVLEVSGGLRWS